MLNIFPNEPDTNESERNTIQVSKSKFAKAACVMQEMDLLVAGAAR
jgi:hypothetical protein